MAAGITHSVQRLATGWTVRGLKLGEGETGPGAHPASCTMGTASHPGVKLPGRGVIAHFLPMPRCEWVGDTPLHPICALALLLKYGGHTKFGPYVNERDR
jgi:hypothetical protein